VNESPTIIPPPRKSRALPRGLAIAVIILALAGGGWILLDKLANLPAQAAGGLGNAAADTARAMARVVKDALTIEPKVVVSSTVIHEGARGAFEVAFAEQEMTHDLRYETTWLGSTKVLHARGRFTVKAGYNLADGQWFVEQKPDGTWVVNLPDPTVLSCELKEVTMVADDDGMWNKLSPEDRTRVHQRLLTEARAKAANEELFERVEKELGRRLREAAAREQGTPVPAIGRSNSVL
jgi:hypothetical protein